MDLNLFNNRKISNDFTNKNKNFINTFVEELKKGLKNIMNEGISKNQEKNILNEPNSNVKRNINDQNSNVKSNINEPNSNTGRNMGDPKNSNTYKNLNEEMDVIEEYNLYEKKKILLDNKSRRGNDLIWIMDENSVYISEHGDGGPYSITEIDLPTNIKVGQVYEKTDEQYSYNEEITRELKKI